MTRKEVDSLFKVVRDLQKKGISILFVSHKLEEVFEIAEELTILRNGKKVIEGPKGVRPCEVYLSLTGRTIETTRFEPLK